MAAPPSTASAMPNAAAETARKAREGEKGLTSMTFSCWSLWNDARFASQDSIVLGLLIFNPQPSHWASSHYELAVASTASRISLAAPSVAGDGAALKSILRV